MSTTDTEIPSMQHSYWELQTSIKHEDGLGIIAHCRWWLIYFLALKHTNYNYETANLLLANLKANFCKPLAYIVKHNRAVNTSGCPGKAKPVNMAIKS